MKETFRSNAEKTLAFLVESGALYLCIWVHSDPLTALHKPIHPYSLADLVYVNFHCPGLSWDGFPSRSDRSTRCKTYLVSCFLNSVLDSFLQGMYPTMVIVVVAMQLSTADILSHPGAEAGSPSVFMPPSPQLQMAAEDAESSQDGRSTTVSSDDTSPRVLAPSFSDKV